MGDGTIVLGIGVLISLILGVINLLARRDKVAVINSEIYPEYLRKNTRIGESGSGPVTLNHAELSIESSCELVLTSGEGEIEVREVEAILDKRVCRSLKRYFRLPMRNRFYLEHIRHIDDLANGPPPEHILLRPKKATRFKIKRYLECTDEFEKEYEKMESGSYPEYIQPLLDELETKYQICWTRYDGKELCWKFPNKWWRNLGKKLWG